VCKAAWSNPSPSLLLAVLNYTFSWFVFYVRHIQLLIVLIYFFKLNYVLKVLLYTCFTDQNTENIVMYQTNIINYIFYVFCKHKCILQIENEAKIRMPMMVSCLNWDLFEFYQKAHIRDK